jgi:DNA-binding transcriptional LysR family regulator
LTFGQFLFTRLIVNFLKANPLVTVELGYNNRPLHMIQEGCDAGLMLGTITDENVVARPAGKVARCIVASPALVKSRPALKGPSDLKSWPWLTLSSNQFGGSKVVTLFNHKRSRQELRLSPLLISEGVSSLREAALGGVGVAVVGQWLVRDDLRAGRLVRVLPAWNVEDLPVHIVYSTQRMLSARVRGFVDFAVAYLTAELGSIA